MTTTLSPAADEPAAEIDPTSPEGRAAIGKAARARVPRSSQGAPVTGPDRADPIDILRAQATTRVPALVPIRHGRMAASAFAFFRGAAAVMAADLAAAPNSGLDVQLCGDAHLVNFGGFASPERALVFDVNDFDETLPGPFEWDVKRLAASIEIAARSRGFSDDIRTRVVTGAVRTYREKMREFGAMSRLDVWYSRLDAETMKALWGADLSAAAVKRFQKTLAKAGSKDRLKAKSKLTHVVDGELRFISDPPLLVPAREVFADANDEARLVATITKALEGYRETLSADRRHLYDGYRFVDIARKVVGVGSVGTRAWVALFVGRDEQDPLFLQVKEAEASVLEAAAGPSALDNHGARVVEGQKLMQAASDIFLGWTRVEDGADGRPHDYYVRQLWDWKASADVDTMDAAVLELYSQMCGWVLARTHARSGDALAIGSYLGGGATFDNALAGYAAAYADVNEADHQRLVDAIASGEVEGVSGV